jgi:hypothetical protein
MEDDMLLEILKVMQKKYQSIVEIERITKDMGECLSRNDRTSVQMLLEMRQDEMDRVSTCEKSLDCLITALPSEVIPQVLNWTKGNVEQNFENPFAQKLVEKGKNIQIILKRTIDIDRHISQKLAGKDSYYKS